MHRSPTRWAWRAIAVSAALLACAACSDDGPAGTASSGGADDTGGALADSAATDDSGAATSDTGTVLNDTSSPEDTGAVTADAGATAEDSGAPDAGPQDVPPVDVGPVCKFGEVKCEGAKLATCGVQEDGWIISNCFPGTTCSEGKCVPVKNNLIVVFDSSGSMTAKVALNCYCGSDCTKPEHKDKKKCSDFLCKPGQGGCTLKNCNTNGVWPACDPYDGCSRMNVSKLVFSAALDKIDASTTRMALFRFPQKIKKTGSSCTSGYYSGAGYVSGEISPGPKDAQFVDDGSAWFWTSVNETMCVDFPPDDQFPTKQKMKKWLDGSEAMQAQGTCPNPSSICKPVAGCAGACCTNTCYVHTDPELRPTGGTPIGKTLFYVGEYLRNRVVIDGKKCYKDADCDNVNYQCKSGVCKDPARSCRDTVVVLFTDGGQSNSPTQYFSPWNQAKRLGMGLACQTDDDCVGGSKCKTLLINGADKGKYCQSAFSESGGIDTFCTKSNKPCLLNAEPEKDKELYCEPPGQCVRHPQYLLEAKASDMKNNVLRSPDGKPFGVRVHVVDISAQPNLTNSMNVAMAGNGKLLGADAADPDTFLASLNAVFDIKNLKVCGEDF